MQIVSKRAISTNQYSVHDAFQLHIPILHRRHSCGSVWVIFEYANVFIRMFGLTEAALEKCANISRAENDFKDKKMYLLCDF